MDKVAFYEEMILNDVFADDAYEEAVEKTAATKYKEMLAGGDLSRKTSNILKFNQGRDAFSKPLAFEGSRAYSDYGSHAPTRNIIGAKLGIGDKKRSANLSARENRLDLMMGKGLMPGRSYHGEKNLRPAPLGAGVIRYN